MRAGAGVAHVMDSFVWTLLLQAARLSKAHSNQGIDNCNSSTFLCDDIGQISNPFNSAITPLDYVRH